jgi:hypothetical protein
MKALFSFILCAFAAITVSAQSPSASVTFFSQDGQKFWVIMDGIKQNDKPDANVKVTGLTNPNYRAKIIFVDNTIPSIDKNIQTVDVEDKYFDATYNIQKDKKGKMVVRISSFSESKGGPTSAQTVPFHSDDKYGSDFSTTVMPTQTTTNQTTTTTTRGNTGSVNQNVTGGSGSDKATINQNVVGNDRGVNSSQTITDPDGNTVKMDMNMGATGGGIKVDDGMGGSVNMNLGINMSGMDGVGTTTTTTTKTTTTTTYSSSGTGGSIPDNRPPANTTPPPPPPAANNGCTFPASSADISSLKGSIQKQSFSDNKMNVAKTFLKNKCVSVSQVKDIMGLFSFEADKLSFAKLAYDRCADKENYYQVSDAFSFSSSNDELTDYINSK